jgi:hypothetical protein
MNSYYTGMQPEKRAELALLRGAHNLWYVYAKPASKLSVIDALKIQAETERPNDRYDFEGVLDECGYRYMEKLANPSVPDPLWQVQF